MAWAHSRGTLQARTASTTAATQSGFDSGTMPAPTLKMCPGAARERGRARPRPRARRPRGARERRRIEVALEREAASEPARRRRAPSTRASRPRTSGAASANPSRRWSAVLRVDDDRDVQGLGADDEALEVGLDDARPRSPRRARRPTSRRSGARRRRRSTCIPMYGMVASTMRASSSSKVAAVVAQQRLRPGEVPCVAPPSIA